MKTRMSEEMTRLSKRLKLALVIVGVGLLVGAAAALASPVHAAKTSVPVLQSKPSNTYCLSCHGQPGLRKTLPDGEVLSLYIDPKLFNDSVHNHQNIACVDCHKNISTFPHPDFPAKSVRDVTMQLYGSCKSCHADEFSQTLNSVHQKAVDAGDTNAAVCTDCHNPHEQTRMIDPQTGKLSEDARLQIPQICARCHSTIYNTYKGSVHGAALTESGNHDVPTCIDCHGFHNIQDPNTAEFHNAIPQLCAKCHTNPQIMDKYGISTQVLNTYVADFHGTTVAIFEQISPNQPTNKPTCIDCHGVHDISNVNNPATGIAIKKNLLVKCQRCHPDVTTANFTNAWMDHYVASPQRFGLVYFVNLFYKIFIPLVIGGMLIFVIADFVRRRIEARKGAHR